MNRSLPHRQKFCVAKSRTNLRENCHSSYSGRKGVITYCCFESWSGFHIFSHVWTESTMRSWRVLWEDIWELKIKLINE